MEADDPFASITELCRVSNSQEDHLRRCRFAGEPEEEVSGDSGEIPVESTGIMMLSPPESSEDNNKNNNNTPKDNDIFQTPPEGSPVGSSDVHRHDCTFVAEQETDGDYVEGEKVVDLGADTDLGCSEVELTQRFDNVNEVIYSESNKATVLRRELTFSESLSESRSKIWDKNQYSQSPNPCLWENIKFMIKSVEKLNSNRGSPYNCIYKSPKSNQNGDASGESSAKRKLEFLSEVLASETEARHGGLEFSEGLERSKRNCDRLVCNNDIGKESSNSGRKSVKDMDKYRYIDPSSRNSSEIESTQRIRALPVSICALGEKDAGKDLDSGNDYGKITHLDVLRILARNCDVDHNLESRSVLDVAKSCGMTFP